MRIHERLFLNPFSKWQRYGIFPVMFCLHMLLLVVVTTQVCYYMEKDITHASTTSQHFSHLFLGQSQGKRTLLSPDDLQDSLEEAVRNIFLVNDKTFNDVAYFVDGHEGADRLPYWMTFRNSTTRYGDLSRTDFMAEVGPHAYLQGEMPMVYGSHFGTQIEDVQFIGIQFGIYEKVHRLPSTMEFYWNLTVMFDGTHVGKFVSSLSYTVGTIGDGNTDYFHAGLSWAVLLFAGISFVLVLRKVLRSLEVLVRVRAACMDHDLRGRRYVDSENLSVEDQLSLFNVWWLLSLVGHCVQILASWKALQTTSDVTNRFSVMGWSCFFTWLTVCQYFESFPAYYVTFSTTSKGLASIGRYMVSVFPILTAFMFLGTCNFWQAANFKGVSASYASLFSLINGDMVHDAFNDLGSVSGYYGLMYVYGFIFFFIYIVLNINISIIQEAFKEARLEGKQSESVTDGFKRQLSMSSDFDNDYDTPMRLSRSTSPPRQNLQQHLATPLLLEESVVPTVTFSPVNGCDSSPSPLTREPSRSSVLTQSSTTRPVITTPAAPFTVKGHMSPRFLDNPRLQGALAAAYPKDVSGRRRRNADRTPDQRKVSKSTLKAASSQQPSVGEKQISWSHSERTSSTPADSPRKAVSASFSLGGRRGLLPPERNFSPVPSNEQDGLATGEVGSSAASSSSHREEVCNEGGAEKLEYWKVLLSEMTELLQTAPMPQRSEVDDKEAWHELQRLFVVHSAAVASAAASLYS